MKQHLLAVLGKQSDKELKVCAEFYLDGLFIVRDNGASGGFDLSGKTARSPHSESTHASIVVIFAAELSRIRFFIGKGEPEDAVE
ncbi:hypothetical protein SCARR_03534 [Pontiella sulfatireligans]|uniref:Uncharacterized protein n=1 Tax=Pontiella sulfatireligans TaxID=2750658 RepID=A0A6C2UMF9_9BACT|nr:hypothetical protein SCARR_03534 [Pontiella sulfatireligans]